MTDEALRDELLRLFIEKAVVRSQVKLASGKISDFYIDGRQVTLDPQGIVIIGKIILHMLQGSHVDFIGGPTLGADPIVTAVILLSSQTGNSIKGFLARKEEKKYGMQKMLEGPSLREGDRVVLVEDVVTTGSSVLRVIQEVEKVKAKVVRIISLVDREAGAKELLSNYQYTPIFQLRDLKI